MPTPSNYLINFTDTSKVAIPISGGQKDGPGFINHSTSLILIGQFAPLYGEDVNENFLHLLENFSYVNAPLYPVVGQLWHKQDDTYDPSTLSPSTPYPGDFNFRVWTEVDNTQGKFNTASFWALPRIVLVDDNVANRTALTPMPGDVWFDTAPNSTSITKTSATYIGVAERVWDFPELKIFDPNTERFESIGRNYIKKNDNGTQTINSHVIITKNTNINQNLTVTGTSALNNNVSITGTLNVSNTSTFNNDVLFTTDVIINGTLRVDQTSIFNNNITINNGNIVSNSDATFIDIFGTTCTISNTLLVNGISTFNNNVLLNNVVTVGTTIGSSGTNLVVIGTQQITGNLYVSGVGYGNIIVDNNISTDSFNTNSLTVSNNSIFNGDLTVRNIDFQNSYKGYNCIDPTSPQDIATKNYIDTYYLRRNDDLGGIPNNMDAVLVLSNINQNASSNNASTVGYVDFKDSFNVKKAGDTIALLHITGNFSVNGTASFNNTIYAGTAYFNNTYFNDVQIGNSLGFTNSGKWLSMHNGYIGGVIMTSSPSGTDVPNFAYVSNEINYLNTIKSTVNPTYNPPKNGDIRVDTSPTRIFIYANGWVQIFPAQYA